MAEHVFTGSVVINGTLAPSQFLPPAGSITNDSIASGADIAADKIVHRQSIAYDQTTGVAVVAETKAIHIAFAAGTVIDVLVTPITAPTSTDAYTVDVHRSTAGGAFATILSSVLTIDNTAIALTPQAATIDTSKDDYVVDDVFAVVIAVPSANTTGDDVIVEVVFEEQP